MENFETDEEEKRRRQIEAYVSKTEQGDNEDRPIISRWNIYRYFKANPKSLAVENIPYNLVLPMQKNVVREFLSDNIPGAKVCR
ncbi:hypothetical protein BC938DRAFT_473377 [Jimgerdemannia flammicorona]|uniref:Uncharacterized protein n=1 Tax=Jimgerdemannia flammicorona TaxID=994334 RepID=A0A433Q424_9FUNG|nr:hypothetical protein BC938DRAFT_473377 [Jimgerdemannia flammicorona]